MAETSMQMLDLNQTSNGLSPPMLESSNGSALFQRRIEFHPARKPFKGFSNGGSDFKLETLNPSTSDSRRQGSTMGQLALVGKKTDGSENFDTGLDPELSFGITFRRIGAGLYNLGNTCFLNSVLQCLTYTEPLAAYLQSGKHQNSCHIAGFCALCAIQKHVSRALQSTGTCLSPDDLVRNLRCVSRNFRNSRQEDAHEYMVNLLECMHRCCLPSGVPSESPSAYEKSLVHKIFGGRLRSQVKCLQCSYCSNTFDPFLDLSIDIFKADSLHKALANFTAAEQLDGGAKQYQCQRCKEKVRATKQMTVDKPPYVLTVHLKRFRAHDPGQKNDKKVNFSSTLDLKPFVSGSYEGDLKYTLYGVLVHYGWSTHSGHYYCFVRTSSGMWYSLDDNRVYQVNERTVLEQKAYMLFYVRDRRNIALKKLNNVVQKENIKLNDNGTRISSNYKQDLKRQVQNGSVQNKSMGTVSSAIVQQDELDISLVKTTHSNEAPGHLPESQLQPSSSKLPSEGVSPSSNARQSPSRTSNCDASSLKKGATSSTGGGTNNYNAKESSKKCSSVLVATSSPNFEDPHNSVKHVRAQALHETCPILPLEDSCLASSKDTSGVESQEENSIKSPVQQKCEKIQVEITAIESATIKPLDKNADESSQSLVNGDSINLSGSSTVTHSSFSGEASACKPQKKLKKILKCHSTRGIIFLRSLSIRKRKKHKRSKNRTLKIKIPSNGLLMEANCLPSDMEPSTSENTNKVPLVSTHSKQKRAQFVSVKDANVSAANKVNAQSDSFTNVEDGESRHRIDQNGTFVAIHKPQQNSSDCADHQSAKGIGNQHDQNKDKIQDGFVGMLTRGLEEAVVGRWDDLELPFQAVESAAVENIDIGYTGDEWDEEYDRGKRKKVRQSKLDFGGPNPFQEIATKKMKLKKAKLDRFSSGGDQPFRI